MELHCAFSFTRHSVFAGEKLSVMVASRIEQYCKERGHAVCDERHIKAQNVPKGFLKSGEDDLSMLSSFLCVFCVKPLPFGRAEKLNTEKRGEQALTYRGIQFGPINSRKACGVAHGAEFAKRFTQSGPSPIFTRSGVNSGESAFAISA